MTSAALQRERISDQQPLRQDPAEPLRLRHRIVRAGRWAGTGFVFDKLLAAVQLIVIARLLVPDDMGLMAASAAVLLAAQTFSELGLEPAIIAKPDLTDEDLRVAWTLSFIRGLALAAALWAAADVIARAMQIPELGLFLRVHTVGILLQSLQSPALLLLSKKLDLKRRVSFDLSRRVIESCATIGLAWWWQNAWALLGGQLTAFLFGLLWSYRAAPFPIRWSLDRPSLDNLWRYGRYQNATAWFLFTVMSGGDLVVARLLGVAALGHYQLAMAIPMMIGVRAMGVISQISLPAYALLQTDPAGARRAFSMQMSLTGMVVVPSALATATLAPHLVAFLFGSSWSAAVDPLRVLSLFAIAAAFCSVMTAFHCGTNRPQIQTRIWAAMGLCYVATVVPLASAWGLVGAAWALALAFLLGLVLNVRATMALLGAEAWPAFDPLKWAGGLAAAVGLGFELTGVVPSGIGQWLAALCGLSGVGLYAWYFWTREYGRLRALWQP
jgi:PST family polysaccharide transporter